MCSLQNKQTKHSQCVSMFELHIETLNQLIL